MLKQYSYVKNLPPVFLFDGEDDIESIDVHESDLGSDEVFTKDEIIRALERTFSLSKYEGSPNQC
jgi:hypothetical protein